MSGYVEAGYIVVLGTLGTYAATLLARERAARQRAGRGAKTAAPGPARAEDLSPPAVPGPDRGPGETGRIR